MVDLIGNRFKVVMESLVATSPEMEIPVSHQASIDLEEPLSHAFRQVVRRHPKEVLDILQPLVLILDQRLSVEEKQLFRSSYWHLASMIMSFVQPAQSGPMAELLFETLPKAFQ